MSRLPAFGGMRPLRRGFAGDAASCAAFKALMWDVFGREAGPSPEFEPAAFFDNGGQCLAGLERVRLPIVLDGVMSDMTGIASVAVAPAWRGRGLFRALMEDVLKDCPSPVLLYTEEPALYRRFGFRGLPQHRFTGAAPAPAQGVSAARRLSLEQDRPLILHLLAGRTPVSGHVALAGGGTLFLAQCAAEPGLALDYLPDQDALIAWELDDACLILADVVAATIPPLSAILAGLGQSPDEIAVLFPPDKLAWAGEPSLEDTGLMIRGTAPTAFNRPFMLPPLAEF